MAALIALAGILPEAWKGTIGDIVLLGALTTALALFAKYVYPTMKAAVTIRENLPPLLVASMDLTALAEVRPKIDALLSEMQTNGGSSLKDQVVQINQRLAAGQERAQTFEAYVHERVHTLGESQQRVIARLEMLRHDGETIHENIEGRLVDIDGRLRVVEEKVEDIR